MELSGSFAPLYADPAKSPPPLTRLRLPAGWKVAGTSGPGAGRASGNRYDDATGDRAVAVPDEEDR